MMRAAVAIVLVLVAHREARAEWYGYQVIGAETVGWTAIGLGAKLDSDPLVFAGVGVLALGPPGVHAVRGNDGRAWISLGMRFGAPVLGAVTALALVPCRGRCNSMAAPLFGGFIGYLAAAVIDAAIVAREPDEPRMFAVGRAF